MPYDTCDREGCQQCEAEVPYQNFDYFAYLIWEQTHKDSLYGKRHSNGSKRSFSRKKPYNQKRLRQTVFMLPENSNKEAV